MTIASKTIDRRFVIADPNGGAALVGELFVHNWTGGDAIKPATPRASYPKVVRSARDWAALRKANSAEALLRAKRKSLLPPQPYSKTVTHTVIPRIMIRQDKGPLTYANFTADLFPAQLPQLPIKEDYRLIDKLRIKAYGSGFNPAVFTAEGKEALGMIANGATRVRLAIGSLLRRDWRGLSRHLSVDPQKCKSALLERRNASSQWLELSYGWLPLLDDVQDGAAYLGYNINIKDYGNNKLVARSGNAQRPIQVVEYRPVGPYDAGFTKRTSTFRLQYIIHSVRKSSTFTPSIATVASVAWEKLPYSFVADWFMPIGSYIQAMRTASDLKGKVIRSLSRETVWSELRFGSKIEFKGYWSNIGGPVKDIYQFDRVISEELNPPLPYSGLNFAPSSVLSCWQRAANAVALITQQKWHAR